ncbi:MAG: histidine ammonia-lyase [Lutibacter sp.]|uniref:histidine ammonia-lyase n=1 Tax=Lutibacter sp. TaxID=1925666 RepID=UPI00179B00C0|nr:histidine ammonia-lyase [Lutibacter sp.]MBT8317377.1 histidine ammonia-lyase [Lutibacter sp.]NNJ58236.1 histidine ammonia-lyase [Lutibacter sp.]
MNNIHFIDSKIVDFQRLHELILSEKKLKLSNEAIEKIENCRNYLDQKIKSDSFPIYGINTGFGSLCNVKIDKNNLQQLQENLVMSHACGTGSEVPKHIVKLMLFLKIQSLSYGHSGVQLKTVERLIEFYNNNIIPVIYTQGSLGASGDLAPLAHLALPLIGKGEVHYDNERISGEELQHIFSWDKIELKSKEGLALLNGTQFMTAYGVSLILKSFKLSYLADLIGALSLEAFDGRISPFNKLIHQIRPHNGQLKTAERISEFLNGSELIEQYKEHVQDPYSFRCMPQVHGASKDALEYCKKTFLTEINSVTDNPNIFSETDEIISGGNFHGQPLAIAFDFLSIAMAELGSISERRTFQLVSGLRSLPPFLVKNPGLNSGFMIPQYTAASIVSQNKQLATPASIDSIVSSNGQEDHVSMGANSATKAKQLVDNIETILSIELFNASQALYFRLPVKTSPFLESFLKMYRSEVPFIENDIVLSTEIKKTVTFIQDLTIDTEELF